MALRSMVTEPYFEIVMQELRSLEQQHGDLAFAMLHRTQSAPDRWKLTLAAPWIDATSLLSVTGEVINDLRRSAGTSADRMGSVLIRSTQDSIVQTLGRLMPVRELGSLYEFKALELSSFDIDEAYCLLSRPELLLQSVAA